MSHPHRKPVDTFEDHQADMAEWIGYATVAEMNATHDPLHIAVCKWLGIPSHALACGRGANHDANLAAIEEEAVLYLQRLVAAHGVEVPA